MQKIQIKKRKSSFIKHPIFLGFLFVFLIIFIVGVFNLFFKMQDTVRNKQISENRLKNLEERKAKLLNDIDNLSSDKGKERVFRENYGYAAPGEGVILIVPDKEIDTLQEEKSSFWLKIKGFFTW